MIIENYTKNKVKEQKYCYKQSLFFSFPRLKMYFNYLTVCEMSKKPQAIGLNFINLMVKQYFYYANNREKDYYTYVDMFNN